MIWPCCYISLLPYQLSSSPPHLALAAAGVSERALQDKVQDAENDARRLQAKLEEVQSAEQARADSLLSQLRLCEQELAALRLKESQAALDMADTARLRDSLEKATLARQELEDLLSASRAAEQQIKAALQRSDAERAASAASLHELYHHH